MGTLGRSSGEYSFAHHDSRSAELAEIVVGLHRGAIVELPSHSLPTEL